MAKYKKPSKAVTSRNTNREDNEERESTRPAVSVMPERGSVEDVSRDSYWTQDSRTDRGLAPDPHGLFASETPYDRWARYVSNGAAPKYTPGMRYDDAYTAGITAFDKTSPKGVDALKVSDALRAGGTRQDIMTRMGKLAYGDSYEPKQMGETSFEMGSGIQPMAWGQIQRKGGQAPMTPAQREMDDLTGAYQDMKEGIGKTSLFDDRSRMDQANAWMSFARSHPIQNRENIPYAMQNGLQISNDTLDEQIGQLTNMRDAAASAGDQMMATYYDEQIAQMKDERHRNGVILTSEGWAKTAGKEKNVEEPSFDDERFYDQGEKVYDESDMVRAWRTQNVGNTQYDQMSDQELADFIKRSSPSFAEEFAVESQTQPTSEEAAGTPTSDYIKPYDNLADFTREYNGLNGRTDKTVDALYAYLNDDMARASYQIGQDDYITQFGMEFLTPEEKTTFNTMYNMGNKEGAMAYLDSLKVQQAGHFAGSMNRQYTANAVGPLSTLASAEMGLATPVLNTMVTVKGLLGGNLDEYDPLFDVGRGMQDISAARSETYGNVATSLGLPAEAGVELYSFVNNLTQNALRNAVTGDVFGAVGDVIDGTWLSTLGNAYSMFTMYSGSSYMQTMESLQSGMDPQEAIVRGAASGFCEMLQERIELKNIFQIGPTGVREFAQTFLENGLQEGAGVGMDVVCDYLISGIFGHQNEVENKVAALRAANVPENEAWWSVIKDYAGEAFMAAASGGLEGGMEYTISSTTYNASVNRGTGAAINANDNNAADMISGLEYNANLVLGEEQKAESTQEAPGQDVVIAGEQAEQEGADAEEDAAAPGPALNEEERANVTQAANQVADTTRSVFYKARNLMDRISGSLDSFMSGTQDAGDMAAMQAEMAELHEEAANGDASAQEAQQAVTDAYAAAMNGDADALDDAMDRLDEAMQTEGTEAEDEQAAPVEDEAGTEEEKAAPVDETEADEDKAAPVEGEAPAAVNAANAQGKGQNAQTEGQKAQTGSNNAQLKGQQTTAADRLVGIAGRIKDNKAVTRALNKVQNDSKKGKTNNRHMGKLYRAVSESLGTSINTLAENAGHDYADAIRESDGRLTANEVTELSTIAAKIDMGAELTAEEEQKYMGSRYGMEQTKKINTEMLENSYGMKDMTAAPMTSDRRVTYESAHSGETITGNFVRMEETQDGLKAVVDLGNGNMRSVSIGELKGGNAVSAMLTAVQNIGAVGQVGTRTINAMIQTYQGGSVLEHVNRFLGAYEMARYAASAGVDYTTRGSAAERIAADEGRRKGTEARQKRESDAAAYEEQRQKNIELNRGTWRAALGESVKVSDDLQKEIDDALGKGSDEEARKAAQKMKSALDFVKAFGNKHGLKIEFFSSQTTDNQMMRNANGEYIASSIKNGSYQVGNTLYVDIYAGMDASKIGERMTANTIVQTMTHELTHFIENNSREQYRELMKLARQYAGRRAWDGMVKQKQRYYASNGVELSWSEAEAEVLADGCSEMFNDQQWLNEQAKAHRGLFESIRDWMKDFADTIREAFSGSHMKAEARMLMREGRYAQDFMQKYIDALDEALENARAEEGISEDRKRAFEAEALNAVAGAKDENGDDLFSLKAMQEDKDEYRDMLVKSKVMTDGEISNLFETLDAVMDYVLENDAILDFEDDADDRVYNPVKPNSDQQYKISLDFSSLCRKRILQMVVQERIESALDETMNREERIAARNALRVLQERGRQIEVACGLCYVESARLKAPQQVERFMADRRFFMRDYFAKHNPANVEHIKQMVSAWKTGRGYEADTAKSKMSSADKKALTAYTQKLYTEYQMTAEEEKLADIADKLPASDFKTAKGLENLKRNHPELANVFNTFLRERTKSKAVETDVSWRAHDYDTVSDEMQEELNGLNGTRCQSWSDFQTIHMLDYMAMIMELSTRKAMLQSYTKVTDYVELMGNTGALINCSLIPMNEKTSLEYDPVEGMDYQTAQKLRDKFHATVGNICIGIGDDHIRSLLGSDDIDFVIPYHASSLAVASQHQMGLKNWKSYQNAQNEKVDKSSKADENDPNYHKAPKFYEWYSHDKAVKYQKDALKGIQNPTAAQKWEASKTAMDRIAADYVQMCHERGMLEKFTAFSGEKGYWKLLIDHKMIDNVTGEIIKQKPVKPNFNKDALLDILKRDVEGFDRKEEDFAEATDIVDGMWKRGEVQKASKMKTDTAQMKYFRDMLDLQNVGVKESGGQLEMKDDYTRYGDTAILKQETVDRYLADYAAKSSPNYAQAYITYMTPDQFLKLTTQSISSRLMIENESTAFDEERFATASVRQPVQLIINGEGKVEGHEGRHRMVSLRGAGVHNVPVLLFNSANKYDKTVMETMTLTGQNFNEYISNNAHVDVSNVQPLSYANRDNIVKMFATKTGSQRIREKYGNQKTLQYSFKDDFSGALDATEWRMLNEYLGPNGYLHEGFIKLDDGDRLYVPIVANNDSIKIVVIENNNNAVHTNDIYNIDEKAYNRLNDVVKAFVEGVTKYGYENINTWGRVICEDDSETIFGRYDEQAGKFVKYYPGRQTEKDRDSSGTAGIYNRGGIDRAWIYQNPEELRRIIDHWPNAYRTDENKGKVLQRARAFLNELAEEATYLDDKAKRLNRKLKKAELFTEEHKRLSDAYDQAANDAREMLRLYERAQNSIAAVENGERVTSKQLDEMRSFSLKDDVSSLRDQLAEAEQGYNEAYDAFRTARDEYMAAMKGKSRFGEEAKALRREYRLDELKKAVDDAGERRKELRQRVYDAEHAAKEGQKEIEKSQTRYVPQEDIRRKLSGMNADYMDAVRRGDKKSVQRLFDEAAEYALANSVVRENGKLKKVFHHTNASFTAFDRSKARHSVEMDGFFFAPDAESSAEYGNNTIGAYLNITSPRYNHQWNYGVSDTAGTQERIRLEEAGYDGLINTDENGNVFEYMAFDENQIFDASPVTYDDNGKVIPLSERFRTDTDDIRYSLKVTVSDYADNSRFFASGYDLSMARNDEERMALRLYQQKLNELKMAQQHMAEQQEILDSDTASASDKQSARNRIQIYSQQVSFAQEKVNNMERSPMISELLKRSDEVQNELLNNEDGIEGVREQLNAEAQETEAAIRKAEERGGADQKKEIARLKAELQRTKEKLALLKSKHADEIAATVAKYREKMSRDTQFRRIGKDNEKHVKSIVDTIKRWDKLRRAETDTQNVPEELKQMVDTIMATFIEHDLNSMAPVAFKDLKARNGVDLLNAYTAMISKDTMIAEALYTDDLMEALSRLPEQLKELDDYKKTKPKGYEGDWMMDKASKRNATLKTVDDLLTRVSKLVTSQRKIFMDGKYREIDQVADHAATEMSELQNQKESGKFKALWNNFIRYGNMTAPYFFKQLRNSSFSTLFKDIERGQSQYGLMLREYANKLEAIRGRYNYSKWEDDTITLETTQGNSVEMSVDQAMQIYATWKREKSKSSGFETKHLDKGGFVLQEERKGGRELNDSRISGNLFNSNDFDQLSRMLTNEQKGYANELVSLMSHDLSNLGNDVSMKMYGIRKYTEDYYVPIVSYRNGLAQSSNELYEPDSNKGSQSKTKASKPGFSKRRITKANNTILIEGMSQVTERHINEMLIYNTMSMSIENLNRVLNFQTQDEDGTKKRVRQWFEQKYGQEALKYLRTWMSDINGGTQVDFRDSLPGKAISNFKKSAVVGSLSVAAQQPLAIIRAGTMINPVYLTRAVAKVKGNWSGKSYDEAKKYSGVAVIKEMGRFEMGVGYSAMEYLHSDQKDDMKAMQRFREYFSPSEWNSLKKVGDKLDGMIGFLPGKMDEVTWSAMWEAVKMEQASKNRGMDTSSEEFLQMCGERFEEVMNYTQVYDSTLTRSQNMRSRTTVMQAGTAFMAEPTLTMNMLYDAFTHMGKNNKGYQSKAAPAAAVTAFALNAVFSAIVKGAFSGLRNKKDPEKSLEDKIFKGFMQNLMGEINPIGSIPFLSDLYEVLASGEAPDDVTYSQIGTALSYCQKLIKTLNGTASNPYDLSSPSGIYICAEEVGGSIAKIFGLPAQNVARDFRAMFNFGNAIVQHVNGTAPQGHMFHDGYSKYVAMDAIFADGNTIFLKNFYDTSKGAYYGRYLDARLAGNEQEANDIHEYLIDGLGVKDDKAIDSQMKSLVRDRLISGEYTAEKAQEVLVSMGLVQPSSSKSVQDVAWSTVQKWIHNDAVKNDDDPDNDSESYSDYLGLKKAFASGKPEQVKAETDTLLEHGFTTDNISSQVTSYFKKDFIAAYKSGSGYADIWTNAETAYKAAGVPEKKINETKESWISSAIKEGYLDGTFTESQATSALVKAGLVKPSKGQKESDAAWVKIQEWKHTNDVKNDDDPDNDDSSYSVYGDLKTACDSGNGQKIRSAVSVLTQHGYDTKKITSQITKWYHMDFVNAYKSGSGAANIWAKAENAYRAAGMSETDIAKKKAAWIKEAGRK